MSNEPLGIIDGDEFDPVVIEHNEHVLEKQSEVQIDQVREMLNRRKRAYVNVFTQGKRSKEDIDIVLADLMYFCKVWIPSYDIRDGEHATELSKRKEGRREVFLRIKDFSSLDSDALLLKYTDATTK